MPEGIYEREPKRIDYQRFEGFMHIGGPPYQDEWGQSNTNGKDAEPGDRRYESRRTQEERVEYDGNMIFLLTNGGSCRRSDRLS